MYERATAIDSNFGGAWLNWGTSLAEQGNMEEVSERERYEKFFLCCWVNVEHYLMSFTRWTQY